MRLTWTALATDPSGRYRTRADFHSAQYETGADVWPQVTPRPIVFQVVLNAPFPLNVGPRFAALVGRASTDRMAAYSDPEWRRSAAEELDTSTDRPRPRWSTFTVAVGSGEVLVATVWDTGAWTSSSPWLPLGRVELAPGPATVRVRARDRVGLAVMNLSSK